MARADRTIALGISVGASALAGAVGCSLLFSGIGGNLRGRPGAPASAIFESVAVGMVILDGTGRISGANPAFRRTFGYADGDLSGALFSDLIHHDDVAESEAAFRELTEGKLDHHSAVRRCLKKDGGVLLARLTASPLRGEDQGSGAIVMVVEDVTERKEAEEALGESERRFRQLFENSSSALFVHDEAGRIVDCNSEACRALGYTREELLALSVGDLATSLLTEEERRGQQGETLWERVLRARPGQIVGSDSNNLRRKDGSTFPVEVDVGAIDYRGRRMIFASARDVTLRWQTEEELRKSERRLSEAQRIARLGNWDYDLDRDEAYWSDEMYRIFGFGVQSFVPNYRSFFRSVYPDDLPEVLRSIRSILYGGENVSVDYRIIRPDGDVRDLHTQCEAIRDAGGRPRRLIGAVQDVTERRRAERALQEAEERYRTLVEQIPAATYIDSADSASSAVYTSPQMEEMLGYAPEEWAEDPDLWKKILHPDDRDRVLAETRRTNDTGDHFEIEYRMISRDGRVVWVRDEAVLLRDEEEGEPRFWQGIIFDMTERKSLEERLSHQAFHDPLTGIPNRTLFANRLDHALAREDRRDDSMAVLFLDLDNFKVINDTLGHEIGDGLLVAVAERLTASVRPADTVARLGGDEFTILLEGVEDDWEVAAMASRLEDELRAPFLVDGHEIFVTASIGVVPQISYGNEAQELLRDADLAMYRAKENGRGRYEVYDPGMRERASGRLTLERDLRLAVERGEIQVHYQPKISMDTGAFIGAEALARWDHPERGLLGPDAFIPAAEETGVILPLGRQVLQDACEQARKWSEAMPEAQPHVCVNLSARQFQQEDLVEEIAGALRHSGLAPESLILEITEGILMEDAEAAVVRLRNLKAIGVRLAVDDFGTGYSSLTYLRRFPVDFLKIDRSFTHGLGRSLDDTVLVSGVISLAQSLNLAVIAEGVETPAQLEKLRELGCGFAQGFYFARPVPAKDAARLMAQPRPDE
ncbi:MAG: PAS domain S-box protein [Rubrobacter sp.]|nr:PAS domain S-box protein [Rubrobacter sp.]